MYVFSILEVLQLRHQHVYAALCYVSLFHLSSSVSADNKKATENDKLKAYYGSKVRVYCNII